MHFISEQEMTIKYQPEAFIQWFDNTYKLITRHETGKEKLRMREKEGKGLYKKFIEELYPLRIITELEFLHKNDIRIQWINGNQNYDALIFDLNSETETKLEITNAVDETDYYRRWMINEEGWAPFSKDRMKKMGQKNLGNFKVESRQGPAMEIGAFFDMQLKLIDKAIDKKANKEYESSTSLAVMFDDSNFQYLKHAHKKLQDFAKEKCLNSIKFSKLYLIGRNKHIYVNCDCLS